MARRKIEAVVRQAAIEDLRNHVPPKEIATKYGIAESTVSRWKHAENIDTGQPASAAVRSKPLSESARTPREAEQAEHITMLKDAIRTTHNMFSEGGLRSHDLKNLSAAAKTLGEALDRAETRAKEEREKARKQHEEEEYLDTGLGVVKIKKTDPYFAELADEFASGELDRDDYWDRRWAAQKEQREKERARARELNGHPGENSELRGGVADDS